MTTLIMVRMVREPLGYSPHFTLQEPYSIRDFTSGDREHWVAIESSADTHQVVNTTTFHNSFGTDERAMERRILFLCDGDDIPVGSAAAWYGDDGWEERGRLHWVAIVPEHQGKGLSKPLVSAALERMQVLGHEKAYLTTENVRVGAICLYARLGFVPHIKNEGDRVIWERIRKAVPDDRRELLDAEWITDQ